MTRTGPVDGRQFLDCPVAGEAQDVTAEWRNPSRGGGSWITNAEAAEYLGLEWAAYARRVVMDGLAGDPAKVRPAELARALVCHGCGAVVRVWLNGRPTSVPDSGPVGLPTHRRRAIDVATGHAARRGKCGGACLGGKRSCDCQCNGRCHGAGTCSCGTPDGLAYRRGFASADAERRNSERRAAIAAGAPHAERLTFTGGGSGYHCADCGAEQGAPHLSAELAATEGSNR